MSGLMRVFPAPIPFFKGRNFATEPGGFPPKTCVSHILESGFRWSDGPANSNALALREHPDCFGFLETLIRRQFQDLRRSCIRIPVAEGRPVPRLSWA